MSENHVCQNCGEPACFLLFGEIEHACRECGPVLETIAAVENDEADSDQETTLAYLRDLLARMAQERATDPPAPEGQGKVRMVCGTCGSQDVRADAYAVWSESRQCWELLTTFDGGSVCENCEGECSILSVPVSAPEVTA